MALVVLRELVDHPRIQDLLQELRRRVALLHPEAAATANVA